MEINIGDTVRYLNDVGGGRIVGFLPDNRALVMDSSTGFEIPVPFKELVVIDREKETTNKPEKKTSETTNSSFLENTEYKKMIFFPQGKLLSGNKQPKMFFGFMSNDSRISLAKNFDVIIVNDSNYTVFYTIYEIDSLQNRKLYVGILAANRQEKIATVERSQLQNIAEYTIHSLFYSNEKLPIVKPWVSTVKVDYQLFERDSAFKMNLLFNGLAFVHKLIDESTDFSLDKALHHALQNNTVQINEKILLDTSPKKGKSEPKSVEKLREVDLHIQVLLENTSSMSPKEILDYQMSIFRKELEKAIIDRVERIVFIHGLGNGTLKTEIRKTLDREYKQYSYHDASFKEYGFGATMVILIK